MFDDDIAAAATDFLARCRDAGITATTAESCTGGLIAAVLTDIAGSSDVFDRGFVTYSNAAKQALLDVSPALLEKDGAVSEPVARAMAEGALAMSGTGIALAVTGIAGPGGGSPEKPVGLVHIATVRRGGQTLHRECRFGNIGRAEIRRLTVMEALDLARKTLA